ncbi:hypothetical protein X975_04440, partial [Stegodyphus mimosarum]
MHILAVCEVAPSCSSHNCSTSTSTIPNWDTLWRTGTPDVHLRLTGICPPPPPLSVFISSTTAEGAEKTAPVRSLPSLI